MVIFRNSSPALPPGPDLRRVTMASLNLVPWAHAWNSSGETRLTGAVKLKSLKVALPAPAPPLAEVWVTAWTALTLYPESSISFLWVASWLSPATLWPPALTSFMKASNGTLMVLRGDERQGVAGASVPAPGVVLLLGDVAAGCPGVAPGAPDHGEGAGAPGDRRGGAHRQDGAAAEREGVHLHRTHRGVVGRERRGGAVGEPGEAADHRSPRVDEVGEEG